MGQVAHFTDIRPQAMPESRFGAWFLGANIRTPFVFVPAIAGLTQLIGGLCHRGR